MIDYQVAVLTMQLSIPPTSESVVFLSISATLRETSFKPMAE